MTEQVRYRINKDLVEDANRVFAELGLTPSVAVSMFYAQVSKLRSLPFRPSEFPVLEEYGVTVAQAKAAQDEILKEVDGDKKAGLVKEFTGKL